MFNKKDIKRNSCQLFGGQAKCGYDWWWHNFTAISEKTGKEKSFFIEYFLCNPDLKESEPVFGQHPDSIKNGKKPSYFMVKAGAWGENGCQLHRFFSWHDAQVDFSAPYSVEAKDCLATENRITGSVSVTKEQAESEPWLMCDSGEMSWDLRVNKKIAYNVGYGASAPMRKLQLFEMFWHAQGMKTAYSGGVVFNGERFRVIPEGCYGYADKNWGKDFTTPWLWLSSNDLTSEITGKRLKNSVFDIGGGRPKIGFISLKGKLLSAFFIEGKEYEFNFSKLWTFTRTKFSCHETDTQIVWHVEQRNLFNRMVADVTCEKRDMLLVNYESPKGEKRHTRLWNGGNGKGTIQIFKGKKLIEKIHAEHIGCEYGEYDATNPYK